LDEASRLANFLGMLCFMYNFCLHGDHFLASGPRKCGYDFIDTSFNTLTLTLPLFLDVPRCVCQYHNIVTYIFQKLLVIEITWSPAVPT